MSGSLYIHVPFCTRKCDYCHFYVIPDNESHKTLLMEGLKREWDLVSPDEKFLTVYFGGGTPSLLGPERIGTILSWIKPKDAEITLEVNPEQVTPDLMRGFADVGINRISLGVQSFDETILKTLSRQHSGKKAEEAVLATYNAGIHNISIDLMYDIPGQTLLSWQESLKRASNLPITHLSLYNLTFEPHTLFFKQRKTLQALVPDEATSLAMYKEAVETLTKAGLAQYEISAFAKPGYTSKHNSGYWTNRPFLGLGPSACSYWQGKRFRNIANLNRYAQALQEGLSPIDFEETLSDDAKRRELLVLNLRLREGVLINFDELEKETKDVLTKLLEQGLLENHGERLRLTWRGILCYDTIATELV